MVLENQSITNEANENPKQSFQAELDETNKAIKEVSLMLEQSQVELGKLSQRNAAISAHLQQIQKQITAVSNEELCMAYDSALDAQQRLFVMRGQLEKLQSDQSHLDRYRSLLERLNEKPASGTTIVKERGAKASLEMLVNAQEAERQRLSRQMHDGPAQALSNFILQSEIAMRYLEVDNEKAREELAALKASAMSTFQKVRNFIFELRPMMLDDLGMVPTIRRYGDMFKEQAGMDLSLTVTGTERRLEPYLEVMIFRALQELLGNTSRHSQASLVKVQMDITDDHIRLVVDDNGKGFDPEIITRDESLGLRLIKERVELLGGVFSVDSSLGNGSRISLSIPIPQ
ncbi:MAG: ATP-binding protein [Chloroflexota bacterium]